MFSLKSIYIKEYKNIRNQKFDFSTNTGYIALIGLNGSGKSNLLEAISLIFDELYGIPATEQVKGYTIKYELGGAPYVYTTLDEQNNVIPLTKGEKVCPSSVIACYSGEDLRLWNMAYMPYYMGFFQKALHGKDYIPQTMYINKYCWKIALISLMFSHTQEIVDFVRDTLHIDINRVRINFAYNEIANPQPHDAFNWLERIKYTYGVNDISLTDLRDFGLGNTQYNTLTEDELIFYYLYFLYMPSKSPRQPVDKLISNISIKLGNYEFDALSEGEKKMILVECITRILGDENSLVLLDEPDAHVHIENKKKLLEEAIVPFEGQCILTTHSPVFVNGIYKQEKNNLFFIEEGALANPDFINNFIALSGGEIDFLSGSIILRSKNILVTEGPYDKKYLEKAIEVLKPTNRRYEKFEQIAIISSGSAGNSQTFYEQVLLPQIKRYDKIVYIFDYDQAGFDGWKKIKKIKNIKLTPMFYQTDYSKKLNQSPSSNDATIMVEDLFDPKAYKPKIDSVKLDQKTTHKHFRCFNENMASSIKTYIENNYSKFDDECYDGFKPVLDELLNVFGL